MLWEIMLQWSTWKSVKYGTATCTSHSLSVRSHVNTRQFRFTMRKCIPLTGSPVVWHFFSSEFHISSFSRLFLHDLMMLSKENSINILLKLLVYVNLICIDLICLIAFDWIGLFADVDLLWICFVEIFVVMHCLVGDLLCYKIVSSLFKTSKY